MFFHCEALFCNIKEKLCAFIFKVFCDPPHPTLSQPMRCHETDACLWPALNSSLHFSLLLYSNMQFCIFSQAVLVPRGSVCKHPQSILRLILSKLSKEYFWSQFFFCQWLSSHVPRLLPVYHSNHYCFIVPFCFSICLQSKHERQEDSKLSRARFVIFQLFQYSCRTLHVRVLLHYQNHQGLWLL